MANFQDTFLNGANIDFIEGLYQRYLEDPSSLDASWREAFAQPKATARAQTTATSPPQAGNGHARALQAVAEKGLAAGARALATQPEFISSAVMGLQAK